MKIFNIRAGFASNSSSTHGFVWDDKTLEENLDIDDHYGWEFFVLKSKVDKLAYFAASAFESIETSDYYRHEHGYMTKEAAEKLVRHYYPEVPLEIDITRGVDHQSHIICPRYPDYKYALDFYRALSDHFTSDDTLAIVGGSDNADEHEGPIVTYKKTDYDYLVCMLKDRRVDSFIIRKENYGWLLFDKNNGLKFRIACDMKEADPDVVLANTQGYIPELIDIKITDYCTKGCDFCYQGSSRKGKHADSFTINNFADSIKDKGVLEVAIGGGEPLCHPNIGAFIDTLHRHGIVPNITTKAHDLLLNYSGVLTDLHKCGSIGVSITNYEEYHDLMMANINLPLVFHFIIGRTSDDIKYLHTMMVTSAKKHWDPKIVLLGMKKPANMKMGKSESFEPFVYGEEDIELLFKMIKKHNMGIDSTMVNMFRKELNKYGIDKKYYYTHEGVASKYVDLVTMRIGANSFGAELNPIKNLTGKGRWGKDYLGLEK